MQFTTSAATAARLVARHLKHYNTVFRADKVYLCEKQTKVTSGPISMLTEQNRMICQVEDGDNIFGLRHTRAMRIHNELDEEMRRRIHAPTKEREYSADQASAEFKEEFLNRFG